MRLDASARTRFVALCAALLLPLPAAASDIFSFGRCQNPASAERARIEALDVATTERAARKAVQEMERRLAAALTDPARRDPDSSRLAATVEGWLLKKEWLAARARREHDADEGVTYCEFLRRQAGLSE